DSIVSPVLQSLAHTSHLTAAEHAELNRLLSETALGQEVISFKVWRPDGTIVFASDAALMGQQFPMTERLNEALAGHVIAELTDLDEEEHVSERAVTDRLMEIY